MIDKEIIIEKTFSEELPYFKERIKEVFDNYNNPNGNEDPLYICVLRDSNRIVRKAEEEITRQKVELNELKHEREVLIEDIHHSADKINEQLEEIERLKADNKTLENVIKNTFFKKAGLDIDPLAEVKSEAIKDFADRLLDKARVVQVGNLTWVWLISQDDINDIIKEMLVKSDERKIYYL